MSCYVILPIIDQDGNEVGKSRVDLERVEGFKDEAGIVWTPATAWAYRTACRALAMTQERLERETGTHARRVTELLAANSREVERRRAAERQLAEYERVRLDDGK